MLTNCLQRTMHCICGHQGCWEFLPLLWIMYVGLYIHRDNMQAVCKTFVFIYVRYGQVSVRRTHTPTEIGPNYRFSSVRRPTHLCESMLLLKVINPSGAESGIKGTRSIALRNATLLYESRVLLEVINPSGAGAGKLKGMRSIPLRNATLLYESRVLLEVINPSGAEAGIYKEN